MNSYALLMSDYEPVCDIMRVTGYMYGMYAMQVPVLCMPCVYDWIAELRISVPDCVILVVMWKDN